MELSALLIFASIYFVAVASPGPGLAAVVARGMGQGLQAAPAFVAGFVVGDLIWFAAAATGLAALARSFESAFLVVKYAGCFYLLYLAWGIWTAPVTAMDVHARHHAPSSLASFLGSLSLTLGNPKVMVFFGSIMPLVVDVKAMTLQTAAVLGLVIILIIAPVMTVALVLADRARRLFSAPRTLRRINRLTAGVMAGAAAAIAARG